MRLPEKDRLSASSTAPPISGRPRQVVDGLWWFPQCLISGKSPSGANTHLHTSSFLVVGDEGALLFDVGLPDLQDDLRTEVAKVLGDRPLDWIVPSHPEYPHSGGLEGLMRAYPDAKVGGDVRDYHLFIEGAEDRLVHMEPGHRIELGGGYAFVIQKPIIKDLVNTVWGYEEKTATLFTADGLSYTHYPLEPDDDEVLHVDGECSLLTTELDVVPTVDQADVVTRAALFWTRMRRTDREFDELDALLKEIEVNRLAPTHGNVITNVDEILPIIKKAHELSYSSGPR